MKIWVLWKKQGQITFFDFSIFCFTFKIFYGNTDSDSVISVFFNEEAKVQFVRILVQEWFNQIGLRFEVMGCPSKFVWEIFRFWLCVKKSSLTL